MIRRLLVIHRNQSLGVEIQTASCSAAMIVDTAFSSSEAIDLFLQYDYCPIRLVLKLEPLWDFPVTLVSTERLQY